MICEKGVVSLVEVGDVVVDEGGKCMRVVVKKVCRGVYRVYIGV